MLRTQTLRGGGGKFAAPDFHLCDERSFDVYVKGLALAHHNPDYKLGDIPFANALFYGQPAIPDQYMPDFQSGSTTVTYGSWVMLNSEFMGFVYDGQDSFKIGASVRPTNQLVTSAIMPVRGALWCNNRRKLGVLDNISLSTLESATS